MSSPTSTNDEGTDPFIAGVYVDGFKSLDRAFVDLRRVTLLTGVNSSGKSSIIQSQLMQSQSLGSSDLVLNGSAVKLGTAADVFHDGRRRMTLGVRVRTSATNLRYLTTYDSAGRNAETTDLHPLRIELAIAPRSLEPSGPGERRERFSPVLRATRVSSEIARKIERGVENLNREDRLVGTDGTWLRVEPTHSWHCQASVYINVVGNRPRRVAINATSSQTRRAVMQELAVGNSDGITRLLESLSGVRHSLEWSYNYRRDGMTSSDHRERIRNLDALAKEVDAINRDSAGSMEVDRADLAARITKVLHAPWTFVQFEDVHPWAYQSWNSSTFEEFQTRGTQWIGGVYPPARVQLHRLETLICEHIAAISFATIRHYSYAVYLGPLRAEPAVTQQGGLGSITAPLGARGEFAADYMLRNATKLVDFVDPRGERQTASLADATAIWMRYLNLGDEVSHEHFGKLGISTRVRIDGADRELTAVGTGVSQVLPILVITLAGKAGTVILEQPEIHLHPAAQARLADFIKTARPDHRFLVETHSEYLITRLRRRVAEGEARGDEINILFVEQDAARSSKVRQIHVDRFGALTEWPDGFFDQADLDHRLIIEAMAGRLTRDDAS